MNRIGVDARHGWQRQRGTGQPLMTNKILFQIGYLEDILKLENTAGSQEVSIDALTATSTRLVNCCP